MIQKLGHLNAGLCDSLAGRGSQVRCLGVDQGLRLSSKVNGLSEMARVPATAHCGRVVRVWAR